MIRNCQIELKARQSQALSDNPKAYNRTSRVRFGNSKKANNRRKTSQKRCFSTFIAKLCNFRLFLHSMFIIITAFLQSGLFLHSIIFLVFEQHIHIPFRYVPMCTLNSLLILNLYRQNSRRILPQGNIGDKSKTYSWSFPHSSPCGMENIRNCDFEKI